MEFTKEQLSHKGTTFGANKQAFGKRKWLTRPDGDDVGASYAVGAQGIP